MHLLNASNLFINWFSLFNQFALVSSTRFVSVSNSLHVLVSVSSSVKKLKDHGNIVQTLPSAIIIEIKQCHLNYLFSCLLLIFYGSCLPNLGHEVLCIFNKMVSVVVKQFRRSFLSHHLAFLKCMREAYSYSCISMVTDIGWIKAESLQVKVRVM